MNGILNSMPLLLALPFFVLQLLTCFRRRNVITKFFPTVLMCGLTAVVYFLGQSSGMVEGSVFALLFRCASYIAGAGVLACAIWAVVAFLRRLF